MTLWWEREIVEPGKLPLLLCFVAFVVTFLVTRVVTRLIRAGRGPFHDVSTAGGVHVHHAVPGLCVLVVGAFVAVGAPESAPWRELAALAVGVGSSLVLDEFALILHLEDVYWSEQGQLSVQAVAVAVAYLALMLVGVQPLGVDDLSAGELRVRLSMLGGVVATMVLFALCLAKGKYRLAVVALFVPVIGLVGAIRLARPGSWWSTHFYAPTPAGQAPGDADGDDANRGGPDGRGGGADRGGPDGRRRRSAARVAAFDARWNPVFARLRSVVAGTPTPDA